MIITVKQFIKEGFFKAGATLSGDIIQEGESQPVIRFTSTDQELNLTYTDRDFYGNVKKMNYSIRIEKVKSNLSKGEIVYFVCPVTYKNCRTLYKLQGSVMFKCRTAYKILYPAQTSSHRERYITNYWEVKKKIEALYQMRATYSYKGKKTRRAERIERLEDKQKDHELKSLTLGLPHSLKKYFKIA